MKIKLAFSALALALFGIGATQLLAVTAYPQREPGVVCYALGQAQLQCPFNPALATQQAPTAKASPTPPPTPSSSPTTALATPTRQNTSLPPTATATAAPPLLVNGDFEQANHFGWTVFHLWEYQPTVNDERGHPESRVDGAQSLRLFNEFRCWFSGVYQTVSVTQFRTYRASVWGRTWASYTSVFPSPSDLSVTDGVALGVDPSGGTDPRSSGIIWIEADNTEVWRKIELQFTALSNHVTIFIRARLGAIPPSACNWPDPFMVSFFDGAGIVEVP